LAGRLNVGPEELFSIFDVVGGVWLLAQKSVILSGFTCYDVG